MKKLKPSDCRVPSCLVCKDIVLGESKNISMVMTEEINGLSNAIRTHTTTIAYSTLCGKCWMKLYRDMCERSIQLFDDFMSKPKEKVNLK